MPCEKLDKGTLDKLLSLRYPIKVMASTPKLPKPPKKTIKAVTTPTSNAYSPPLLQRRVNQLRMLKRIRRTGKEAHCFQGVCSERTYRRFIKDNPEWQEEVSRAIKEFYNHQKLTEPGLREKLINQLIQKIENGHLSVTEILRVDQYLSELQQL